MSQDLKWAGVQRCALDTCLTILNGQVCKDVPCIHMSQDLKWTGVQGREIDTCGSE